DDAATAILARADTFFVASVDPRPEDGLAAGADISHRGGRPGFIRVDDARTITTPDFVGNFLFNTLGNLLADDRAGLLVPDFETGDLLYLAGRAEVIWDGPEVAAFAGAQRLVRYHLHDVIRVERSLPLAFSAPEPSPLHVRTGTWAEAQATLDAEALRTIWRPFRIAEVADESRDVRSFRLEPADGRGLPGHRPGQFLPIRVQPEGWAEPATRTYTLSDAAGGAAHRISVKREGRGGVSDWLHDHAGPGTAVEVLAPRGSFAFASEPNRSVVLVSAGIGITPMLAMLNDLLVNNGRTRHHAPIWFVHGARDGAHQPFAAHLRRKAELHSNLRVHVRYSAPRAEDVLGRDYDAVGRVDIAALKALLPFDAHDFYLCGPPGFMQSLYDGLRDLDVPDSRIRLESFGPSSVLRRPDAPTADREEAVLVTLARSERTLRWRPQDGSLLDAVEKAGVSALSSCRSGVCGTCATRVVTGTVDYAEPPVHEIAPGEALICVGRPHPGPHLDDGLDREGVTLDL
ncbi:MAG: pyridoxamine 5'-phosphate oxidase family protein, partial [Methylobacteriaceae bacterium]|nr:pyridoxamine 5'-phosphate oxidase family protein [Methylobacteriaceae bacterium]